ncbi:antibiotic biosynthesis monooxygenase [Grimontia sp. SpTr1]|uniref:antibiotic biosynthesis monooxygenase family protein n=1 Tax=Grimontia sp. SpTr1 TaxID=2995319 RepID=UPI00248B0735|nr:antibiotic biosynthesis monooxygenase [Grimontia sp. SpTr1]
MIAVIFEVEHHAEHKSTYLDLAAVLRNELMEAEGFISVERFQSLTNEERMLSLSFWESEEAIAHWRSNLRHQLAQQKGKESLFKNYRIRVANVVRNYGLDAQQGEER